MVIDAEDMAILPNPIFLAYFGYIYRVSTVYPPKLPESNLIPGKFIQFWNPQIHALLLRPKSVSCDV